MPCNDLTSSAIEIIDKSINIADGTSRSEKEEIDWREKRRHLQFEIAPKTSKNIKKMTPRPMNATTKNLSASCSSSSSSSSSSCYDRPRQNDSTNSSSSLILILERPEIDSKDAKRDEELSEKDNKLSIKEDNDFEDFSTEDGRDVVAPPSSGFAVKVTTSSIENLAKKKAATSTTRCRRKRSSASPRNHRNSSIIIDDKKTQLGSVSFEARSLHGHEATGFVATSTLTKTGDCSALSISKNSSRTAAKLRLQSSTSGFENDKIDFSRREIQNVGPHGSLKSQQSTISVAAIRGTNVALESRNINNNSNNNNNNNKNNSNDSSRFEEDSTIRRDVPFASAPSLISNKNHYNDTNNKNREIRENRDFSSQSSSSRHLSMAIVSTRPLSSTSSLQSPVTNLNKHKNLTPALRTTSGGHLANSVKSSTARMLASNRDLSTGFSSIDNFSPSLKSSSSFSGPKVMRNNKNRPSRIVTSLHASLGQLPTTASSCATSATTTTTGEATSLENMQIITTPRENNEETTFVPINFYSTNSSPGETKNFSNQINKNVSEKIYNANGGSTNSSSYNKTPIRIAALSEVENSPNNVASAFRNNLAVSGCNNNNNNINNNSNNARCNHLVGSCACSGTTTTSQTSSTVTRTTNLVNGIATSSSWTNNSVEQETDYVVDPVQGNAYHKGQFLGKGGFARVYLMTDVANGNQYACKIIPKNRMQKIHIQKIAREIMIHKELNHVNVVQMHHYFEDNINVYMLLEPCPRKSLMHVLKYRGKVTEPEARYYMKQMVTGVAYIHSQKVVHRDLKPGNMFLSDGMIVKIGDFGLATRPDGQRRRVTICGTPNYIAPEVLYKQAYSYEADVWALGCILYALLAGQPPFDTSTLKETYARICNNRYKKLDDSLASRSGQDLIRWLLQPVPELRPSLERVKEHAYLTMEYVPTKLSHTCCYRIPISQNIIPEQSSTMNRQILNSGNSMITQGGLGISNDNNNRNNKNELAVGTLLRKNLHQGSNGTMSQINLENSKISGLTKKPKVGNWLFRKLPKLPKFRQRLTKLLCPENKKPDSVMMHRAIESCLAEIRCTRARENPMLVDRIAPLFVTKWIDYSNKYGLGFQLSDRSVGVLFNDSTKMSYTHDRRRVEYATTEDEVTRYRNENEVPSSMEEKLELLRHFTHYMDNFLTNGGEVKEQRTTKFSRSNSTTVPRMRRWLRTDKAIVMELTVPLLQVNFFVDHSKIVVSEGTRGRGYLVTYIDASRQASSYWLNDLREVGCTSELYDRLHYVSKVIAELENDAIFESAASLGQNRNKT